MVLVETSVHSAIPEQHKAAQSLLLHPLFSWQTAEQTAWLTKSLFYGYSVTQQNPHKYRLMTTAVLHHQLYPLLK